MDKRIQIHMMRYYTSPLPNLRFSFPSPFGEGTVSAANRGEVCVKGTLPMATDYVDLFSFISKRMATVARPTFT